MTPLLQYAAVAMVARFLYRIVKMGVLLLWRRPVAVRTEQDVALYFATKEAYDTEYSRHRINQVLPSASVVVLLVGMLLLPPLTVPLCPPVVECASNETVRTARGSPPATTLAIAVQDCLLATDTATTHCYHTLLWRGPVRDTRHTHQARVPSGERSHFVDYNSDHYFRTYASVVRPIDATMDESAVHVVTAAVLVKEKLLRQSLARLFEHDGEHCVCPERLGLYDNVAFLHYEEATSASRHWIVMLDPVVVGPAPGATRVHTTVDVDGGEQTRLAHYDKFIVSFAAPQLQMEPTEVARLIEYNNRLRYVTEAGDRTQDAFIVRRIAADDIGRISIVLSGQDASCFIYCQHSSSPRPLRA